MKKRLFLSLFLCLLFSKIFAQVPEWQHIPGPDGGEIVNFDLDGNVLYALTKNGIYRSDDEGYNWQLLPNSFGKTRDKSRLKVEKNIFYAMEQGDLYRSDDQGNYWKPILQKPFPMNFDQERLQQFFVKEDTVLVGSLFTIYRSTDRGETWTSTADMVPASFLSIFEFKNELFAAQDRFIYRSTNGGKDWNKVFTNAVGYSAVVATDSFLLAFYGNRTRMIRSSDGLRTWQNIYTDTIEKHLEVDPWGASPQQSVGGKENELYFFQTGDSHYFCPIRFCYSKDGGLTWHRGNNGAQAPIGRKLKDGVYFDQHIVLGSEQIQHSVDGAKTFFPQQNGLKNVRIIQLFHQNEAVFATTNHRKGNQSNDLGDTWGQYSFPTEMGVSAECASWFQFYRTQDRIFRSREKEYRREFSYKIEGSPIWNTVDLGNASHENSTNHYFWYVKWGWSVGNYIPKLWRLGAPDTVFTEIQLSGLGFPEHPYFYLLNLGNRLGLQNDNDLYILNEQGEFIRKLPPFPCSTIFVFGSSELHYDGDTYFNFCGDRSFMLGPNDTDWQEIYPQDWTTGIPLYHNRMTFFESHEGVIWVGLEGKGLFYATDHSGRFYPAVPQMPYPYPLSVSFTKNEVWVGTDGGGIWTYPIPESLQTIQKPTFSVFPNPSTGELNLHADQFLKEAPVFTLFDASGRQMAQQVLSPGQYWNLNFPGLSKGFYFLQMRTESGVVGLKWVVGN